MSRNTDENIEYYTHVGNYIEECEISQCSVHTIIIYDQIQL